MLAIPATLAPGATLAVPITFTPSGPGDRTATFSIATNAPGSPLTVAVSGTGVPAGPPRLATNPVRTTGFGPTPVGSTRSLLLQLLNTGLADLHVSALTVTATPASNDFTAAPASPLPLTIAPGSQAAVTLTWKPTAAGNAQATIQVSSDDPIGPAAVVVTGWTI